MPTQRTPRRSSTCKLRARGQGRRWSKRFTPTRCASDTRADHKRSSDACWTGVDDSSVGGTIAIVGPNGQQYQIAVPAGLQPGNNFIAQVPGSAPPVVETTGTSQAIASPAGRPKPSYTEGDTAIVDSA